MEPATERRYIQMARDRPGLLCSEVPLDLLLETVSDENEPSDFIQEFLETGHTQWRISKFGRLGRGEQQVKDAVVVLWVRAMRLNSSHLLGRSDPDWDKPFFSDEDLY